MYQSRPLLKLLIAIGAAVAILAMTVASASAATPAPGYERFAGCPSPEENASVAVCNRSIVDGGHFQMGNKKVPIANPLTLTGGANLAGEIFANSKGGLTPVKQPVPGGIIGLTGLDWLVNFLNLEGLKLYAVTELAGQPKIGDGLILPIKVHLINPVLGNNCYVGSSANPIVLNLKTGTTNPPPPNKPITGQEPEKFFDDEFGVSHFENAIFVDNAFSAPGASGCTLTLFGFIPISINGLVNSQSGLPSPAGTNETVQHMDLEIVPRSLVYP